MVAHERPCAAFTDEIDAFERIGAVADDVAETDDAFDAPAFDVLKDAFEGLGVGVDVADDGGGHACSCAGGAGPRTRGERS